MFLQRISMHIQNSLFTLAFLIMGVAHCFSQEICDNGIDDDSDGLVDLNDPDCSCGQEIWTLLDNIPNPSFEEKLCTPNSLSQLFCVTDWEQPAPGTTDYFHTDGLNYNCLFPSGSLPDGNGYIGFHDVNDPDISSPVQKEYAAVCLNGILEAGNEYNLTFQLGFANDWNCVDPMTPNQSPSPYVVGIFGTSDCGEIPFEVTSPGVCPTANPNWVQLGLDTIAGSEGWVEGSISFTPGIDIFGFAIGPACPLAPASSNKTYMFLDDLKLYGKDTNSYTTGYPCTNDVAFSVEVSGASFQWYKNGVAVPGETGSTLGNFDSYDVNDVYQVKIEYPNGCAISDTFSIPVAEWPELSISDLVPANCNGGGGATAQVNGGTPPYQYLWSNQSDQPFLENAAKGSYSLVVTDDKGCTTEGSVEVTEFRFFDDLLSDTTLCPGYSLQLDAHFPGASSYKWNTGAEDPVIEVFAPGVYAVELTYQGCHQVDSLNIREKNAQDCPSCIYVPNAFSPNGDGFNDTFQAYLSSDCNLSSFHLSVFDRWGGHVFETYDISTGWDGSWKGKAVVPGLYVYHLVFNIGSGPENFVAKELKGGITVVR